MKHALFKDYLNKKYRGKKWRYHIYGVASAWQAVCAVESDSRMTRTKQHRQEGGTDNSSIALLTLTQF